MTDDFETFTRLEHPLMPFNRNGVLFPRKVDGHYLLLSRPSDSGHTPFGDIVLSHSPDLTFWGKHRLVMRSGGPGWWQGVKIGAGPVPIETDRGWLLIYHGVSGPCNGFVYSMGAALLDLERPEKVLARTRDYLLTPARDYETVGFVPNVAFPCATLQDAATGRIAIYYGAADTYTAIAFTQLDLLLDGSSARRTSSDLDPSDCRKHQGAHRDANFYPAIRSGISHERARGERGLGGAAAEVRQDAARRHLRAGPRAAEEGAGGGRGGRDRREGARGSQPPP